MDASIRIADLEAQLSAKDQELAAKDQQLAAKGQELAAKDQELAAKDQELAALKDERDAAVLSACQVIMAADRWVWMEERKLLCSLGIPCRVQHSWLCM